MPQTNSTSVTIKLFARASELTGTSELAWEIPTNLTVGEFRKLLLERCPELQSVISTLFIAINAEYAQDQQIIAEGAEIACFPPVSGG